MTNAIPSVPLTFDFLLDRMEVSDEDLQMLARDRARIIEQMLSREGIKTARLFVVTEAKKAVTPTPPGRVEFDLLI